MQISPRFGGILPITLILMMILAPFAITVGAEEGGESGENNANNTLNVLAEYTNPSNSHTYYLLEEANHSESVATAEALGGTLVSINDPSENQWIVSTFVSWNGTPRDIWSGLTDADKEGYWQWDSPQPAWYRNWAKGEPSMEEGEDYMVISADVSGEIQIGQWIDQTEDKVAHGLVEIGEGADNAILFPAKKEQQLAPQAIMEDVENINISNQLTLEARVMPFELEGSRFIMMKGDYGWGMQLKDGILHYANDYAIRNHPSLEDVEFLTDEWAHLAITIEDGVGGSFWVDGEYAGAIDANDSVIPTGDFGSNQCYQSGEDCDEFYLARQGAGCDCNNYVGVLDDVRVWNRVLTADEVKNASNGILLNDSGLELELDFDEGSGDFSFDDVNNSKLELKKAIWVDLDGNPLVNAKQLANNDDFTLSGKENTRHLFWIDVPERVQFMNVEFWGWNGKASMFIRQGAIPTEEVNDYSSKDNIRGGGDWDIGWGYGNFAWPDAGVWWVSVEGENQFQEYSLSLWMNQVPEPPALEQMTELHNGIPVPDQDIDSNDVAYYYLNVTEPIDKIEIVTYGGEGDGDLYVAYDADPVEWNGGGGNFWIDDMDEIGSVNGRQFGGGNGNGGDSDKSLISGDERYGSSAGGDNDERVTLLNPIEGIWYIGIEAFENTRDMNIVARFTYPPANADPLNSIELQPGVPYYPVSGNEESDRYFHINVTQGTERLEVQIEGGNGDADLYVSYGEVPSREDYQLGSSNFGNSEFVANNMPPSGQYFILVTGYALFEDLTITASFTESSDYKPEIKPIQLFNNEAINHLRASEGDELLFYFNLEEDADSLSVSLNFGNGNPNLFVSNTDDAWDSTGRGPWESVWIEEAVAGRYDVRVLAANDFDGSTIRAEWYSWDNPDIPEIPPEAQTDCKATAVFVMDFFDLDEDGQLSEDEFISIQGEEIDEPDWDWEEEDMFTGGRQRQNQEKSDVSRENDDGEIEFDDIDTDGDENLSFNELLLFACSCKTELTLAEDWKDDMDEDSFNEFEWKNDFTFEELDKNDDGIIDRNEFDDAREICETTWDPFDLNQEKPEEPEDENPKEEDGILGTEYLSGLDKEVIVPLTAGIGILVLVLIIMAFAQVKKSNAGDKWHAMEEDIISRQTETMLDNAQGSSFSEIPTMIASEPVTEAPEPIVMGDVLGDLGLDEPTIQDVPVESPPSHIMGALQSGGSEQIEWPSGSGNMFTRASFDAEWKQL
ncbi:pre-peptidase C-terminal domain-containing protein [Deltaproteobacteria bacterium]|nr:pre-peptidase C-terminal domain-containing protein [Deltaproteobacteria bacterium]